MTGDELKLELERIRGDIKNLETVVRMSVQEQTGLTRKYENDVLEMTVHLERIESKLWWIQGILGSTGVAMTVSLVRLLAMLK